MVDIDTTTDITIDTGDDVGIGTRTEVRRFPQSRFSPPPGSTEILLVRHGESAPHVEGEAFDLVDGHGDPPLAPAGWEQARLAAQRLIDTGERIAAVYVTTLQRTHQTAEPLLEYLEMEATEVADGLREKIETAIRDVTKLRGDVQVVRPGSLPNDGKVIEDARSYQ